MAWEDTPKSERGYIAGLVDADGSISISKQKNGSGVYYRPTLTIYNSKKGLLKWVGEKLDGDVEYQLDGRIDKRHSVKSYQLTVRKLDDLKIVLEQLLPHLRIKSDQAKLAISTIEIIQTRDSYEYTDEILKKLSDNWDSMKELNEFDTEVEL